MLCLLWYAQSRVRKTIVWFFSSQSSIYTFLAWGIYLPALAQKRKTTATKPQNNNSNKILGVVHPQERKRRQGICLNFVLSDHQYLSSVELYGLFILFTVVVCVCVNVQMWCVWKCLWYMCLNLWMCLPPRIMGYQSCKYLRSISFLLFTLHRSTCLPLLILFGISCSKSRPFTCMKNNFPAESSSQPHF